MPEWIRTDVVGPNAQQQISAQLLLGAADVGTLITAKVRTAQSGTYLCCRTYSTRRSRQCRADRRCLETVSVGWVLNHAAVSLPFCVIFFVCLQVVPRRADGVEGACVLRRSTAVLPFNPTLRSVTIEGRAEVA